MDFINSVTQTKKRIYDFEIFRSKNELNLKLALLSYFLGQTTEILTVNSPCLYDFKLHNPDNVYKVFTMSNMKFFLSSSLHFKAI